MLWKLVQQWIVILAENINFGFFSGLAETHTVLSFNNHFFLVNTD